MPTPPTSKQAGAREARRLAFTELLAAHALVNKALAKPKPEPEQHKVGFYAYETVGFTPVDDGGYTEEDRAQIQKELVEAMKSLKVTPFVPSADKSPPPYDLPAATSLPSHTPPQPKAGPHVSALLERAVAVILLPDRRIAQVQWVNGHTTYGTDLGTIDAVELFKAARADRRLPVKFGVMKYADILEYADHLERAVDDPVATKEAAPLYFLARVGLLSGEDVAAALGIGPAPDTLTPWNMGLTPDASRAVNEALAEQARRPAAAVAAGSTVPTPAPMVPRRRRLGL